MLRFSTQLPHTHSLSFQKHPLFPPSLLLPSFNKERLSPYHVPGILPGSGGLADLVRILRRLPASPGRHIGMPPHTPAHFERGPRGGPTSSGQRRLLRGSHLQVRREEVALAQGGGKRGQREPCWPRPRGGTKHGVLGTCKRTVMAGVQGGSLVRAFVCSCIHSTRIRGRATLARSSSGCSQPLGFGERIAVGRGVAQAAIRPGRVSRNKV